MIAPNDIATAVNDLMAAHGKLRRVALHYVGLALASLIALCGALIPSRAYFGRVQTNTPHIALVGESSIGRKGTAMNRALIEIVPPVASE